MFVDSSSVPLAGSTAALQRGMPVEVLGCYGCSDTVVGSNSALLGLVSPIFTYRMGGRAFTGSYQAPDPGTET